MHRSVLFHRIRKVSSLSRAMRQAPEISTSILTIPSSRAIWLIFRVHPSPRLRQTDAALSCLSEQPLVTYNLIYYVVDANTALLFDGDSIVSPLAPSPGNSDPRAVAVARPPFGTEGRALAPANGVAPVGCLIVRLAKAALFRLPIADTRLGFVLRFQGWVHYFRFVSFVKGRELPIYRCDNLNDSAFAERDQQCDNIPPMKKFSAERHLNDRGMLLVGNAVGSKSHRQALEYCLSAKRQPRRKPPRHQQRRRLKARQSSKRRKTKPVTRRDEFWNEPEKQSVDVDPNIWRASQRRSAATSR